MKKLLAVFFILILTNCAANATTSIHYNRAGMVVSIAPGVSRPMSQNVYEYNMRIRQRRYAHAHKRPARPCHTFKGPAMTRAERMQRYGYSPIVVQKKSTPVEVSRFSKNYTIPAQKFYTKNGITYYN